MDAFVTCTSQTVHVNWAKCFMKTATGPVGSLLHTNCKIVCICDIIFIPTHVLLSFIPGSFYMGFPGSHVGQRVKTELSDDLSMDSIIQC